MYHTKLLSIFRDTCEFTTVGFFFLWFSGWSCLNCFPKECAEGGITSLCYALQFFFFPLDLELVLPECKRNTFSQQLLQTKVRRKQVKQNRETTFHKLEGYRTFQSGMLTLFLGQETAVNIYLCSIKYIYHTNHRLLFWLACL